MSNIQKLFMISMNFFADHLMRLGLERGLPLGADNGYLLHMQLYELFGQQAPKPFAVVGTQGKRIHVLGYSAIEHHQLQAIAESNCGPIVYRGCDWATLKSKELPRTWNSGQRLAFDVCVCPVVRMASAGKHHRKGAEVDAFLQRCWQIDDPHVSVSREEVYRDWLTGHLERNGARLEHAKLTGFLQARLLRRTQGATRKAKGVQRPVAMLSGELEIMEGSQFTTYLAQGIGRHKSFGFGMLLIRPCSVRKSC